MWETLASFKGKYCMDKIVHVDEQWDLLGVLTLSHFLSSTFIQPGKLYYPVLEEGQMNFKIHLMFTRKMNRVFYVCGLKAMSKVWQKWLFSFPKTGLQAPGVGGLNLDQAGAWGRRAEVCLPGGEPARGEGASAVGEGNASARSSLSLWTSSKILTYSNSRGEENNSNCFSGSALHKHFQSPPLEP